ncbi:MAG: DNA gyrase inhibitor [uncultured Sulfurovum sp.]|uniref:DNA gyrase inhibitor n=1 Tax=uncultured Sulfurovum sp. TaxID=269237 RepID=A0A6S6TV84_9BACT|nr:MAG: DNA gyrase inhibitor [uncultured Sulfurovum sp.]
MYSKEIIKVIEYIETNLFEELELEQLSVVAGYSKYHFARLFKEATGESIISMIKRLRLEKSAKDLFHLNTPVTEIGLNVGYWTPSSYNKAFKQKFKQSPSLFRETSKQTFHTIARKYDLSVEIIERKPQRTLSYRAIGDYKESSYVAWNALINILDTFQKESNEFISTKHTNCYGLAFDIPTITDENLLRYEGCVEVSDELDFTMFEIYHREIPGGTYAKVTFQGDYDDIYDVWVWFYGWVQKNQYKLANFPPLECYLDDPREVMKELPPQPTTELLLLLEP